VPPFPLLFNTFEEYIYIEQFMIKVPEQSEHHYLIIINNNYIINIVISSFHVKLILLNNLFNN